VQLFLRIQLQMVGRHRVCTVYFFSWWKICAWGCWYLSGLETFLDNCIADCLLGMGCALSVLFRPGKLVIEAIGFRACTTIHASRIADCFHMQGCAVSVFFLMENIWLRDLKFWAFASRLENGIADFLSRHVACTLSVLFRYGIFLPEAVRILSLCTCSWESDCRLCC